MDRLQDEEVEFYVEMAMEECARWIQAVTRERLLDHKDFLYSLRFGTQLRRLLNLFFPFCFDLSVHIPSSSKSIFNAVGMDQSILSDVDDEDWILQFLFIAHYKLELDDCQLFYAEDLFDDEDSEEIYEEFLKSQSTQGRELGDRLRRVCITLCTLSRRLLLSHSHLPLFDYSAIDPLIEYHQYLVSTGKHEYRLIFDRPNLDVVDCVKELVDHIVSIEYPPILLEGDAMDSAEYKVNRFLHDLGGEQTDATDDFSYSSLSPSDLDRLEQLKDLTLIPTRTQTRGTSVPASDPLHFVSVNSAALALSEHAKQIISVSESQKRQRNKDIENPPRFADEEEWMSDLDTWRRKRKQKKDVCEDESLSYQPAALQRTEYIPMKSKVAEDSKEEILTVFSPNQDIDSGIDRISPSTSADFSPRSDSKFISSTSATPQKKAAVQELHNQRSISERSETPPPDHAPPPPPLEEIVFSESEKRTAREKLDQVLIEVAVPGNKHSGEERVPNGERGRHAEEDDFPSPPPHVTHAPGFKNPVTTTRYECDRTREESARVETTLHFNPVETQRVEQRLRLEDYPSTREGEKSVLVELTVELNREQNGQVSTSKYPQKTQESRARTQLKEELHSQDRTRSRSVEKREATMVPPVVGTIYKAVDIPFDDSSKATYQPKTNGFDEEEPDGAYTVVLEMGSHPVHKGFGFNVSTEKGQPVRVDAVVVGTPADRGKLQVGDQIYSINGESVLESYPSAITRMLHEAARLGEVEMRVVREAVVVKAVSTPSLHKSSSSFDKTRSMFQEATKVSPPNSYADFKKKSSLGSLKSGTYRQDSTISQTSLSPSSSTSDVPRGGVQRSSTGTSSFTELYRTPAQSFRDHQKNDEVLNQDNHNQYGSFSLPRSQSQGMDVGFRKSYGVDTDYRVTSTTDRSGPGKLSDFIPEVERAAAVAQGSTWEERRREVELECRQRADSDEPKLIRNYDLKPTPAVNSSFALQKEEEDSAVSAVLKRSTLPRNASTKNYEDASEIDGDGEGKDGRSYLHDHSTSPQQRSKSAADVEPRQSILKKPAGSRDDNLYRTEEYHRTYEYERTVSPNVTPVRQPRRSSVTEVPINREVKVDVRQVPVYTPLNRSTSEHAMNQLRSPDYANVRSRSRGAAPEYEEMNYAEIGSSREFPIVRAYGSPGYTVIPVERKYQERPQTQPRRAVDNSYRTRAKSSDALGARNRMEERIYDKDGVSPTSHRFYNKEGKTIYREQTHTERIEITRSYDKLNGQKVETDPREWRQVVKSQRQPVPGQPVNKERIQATTQSLSNLPNIINKRMREQEEKTRKEQEKADRESREYLDYARRDVQQQQRLAEQERYDERHMRKEIPIRVERQTDREQRDFSTDRQSTYSRDIQEKDYGNGHVSGHVPVSQTYSTPFSHQYDQPPADVPPVRSYSDYGRIYETRASGNPQNVTASSGYGSGADYGVSARSYGTPSADRPVPAHRSTGPQTSTVERPLVTVDHRQPANGTADTSSDQVVAVSGKHRCGHCNNELGRGQAMIIESLNLYYHLACFRCFVCNTLLGNGTKGADVRVRNGKLHCQSCYSNDQVQLSKV